MGENEAHQRALSNDEQHIEDDKGPTEKLRDQEKSQAEELVPGTELPGTELPGAQNPDSEEIKDEKGPNTE